MLKIRFEEFSNQVTSIHRFGYESQETWGERKVLAQSCLSGQIQPELDHPVGLPDWVMHDTPQPLRTACRSFRGGRAGDN